MTTTGGLFIHRGVGQGRAFLAHRALSRQRKARFAEALANGATITAASKAAGVSQQYGSKLLAEMRRELGWQAQ